MASTASAASASPAGWRWTLILALPLCSSAILWYGFTIGVLLPDISRDLGLSRAQEGLLSSSFFIGQLIFSLPGSSVLSRYHPVRQMAVVLALTTVILAAATVLPGYWPQLIARFVVAVLFVAINPVRTLVIGALFPTRDIPKANSIFNSVFGLVQGAAFFAAGPLLHVLGSWRAMFGAYTAISAVSTVAWMVLGRGFRRRDDAASVAPATIGTSPMRVLRRADVWYLSLIGVGAGATWTTYITFWPAFAQDSLHFSKGEIGFAMGVASMAIVPGSLSAAWLLARVGKRRPLLVAATLLQIPAFALTLVTGNLAALVAVSAVQGFLWFYFPLLLSIPFEFPGVNEREIVVITGVFVTVNSGALALGPAVAGPLADVLPMGVVLFGASLLPLISTVGVMLLGNARAVPAPPITPMAPTGATS